MKLRSLSYLPPFPACPTPSLSAAHAARASPRLLAGTRKHPQAPTRQAALLADGAHLAAAPGQDFVDVCLVAHIKDDLVLWGVEHIVQRQGELHHAQAAAQVPAGLGNLVDQVCIGGGWRGVRGGEAG